MSDRYRTIVADPPWRYTNKADGVKELGASEAERAYRYHTMRTEDMALMSVASLTEDDAHLYMGGITPSATRPLEGWPHDFGRKAVSNQKV